MRNTIYGLIFAIFVSILSEANSNYMLIDLDDEEYMSTKDSIGPSVRQTHSRKGGEFSTKVPLKDRYKKTCSNADLVRKGEMIMMKTKSNKKGYNWDFKALLDKGTKGKDAIIMSELNAEDEGYCNQVKTNEGYRGCGLATTLMEFCFSDEDVGGMVLEDDSLFGPRANWRELAKTNCKHMIALDCAPEEGTPYAACAGYLTAAINKGHMMMFTYPNEEFELEVMHVGNTAKPKLKKDANKFIEEYGNKWYFCKCKPERLENCLAMATE